MPPGRRVLDWLDTRKAAIPVIFPVWPGPDTQLALVAALNQGESQPVKLLWAKDEQAMREDASEFGSRALWFVVPRSEVEQLEEG